MIRWVVGLTFAVVLALGGWVLALQKDVSEAKAAVQADRQQQAANPQIEKVLASLQTVNAQLEGLTKRIEKVEGTNELILRRHGGERLGKPITVRELAGVWDVIFTKGSKGEMAIEYLDEYSFRLRGKEQKPEGAVMVSGTGQLKDGRVVMSVTATPETGKPYSGKTELNIISSKLMKGFFSNELGDLDLVTATKKE
jgi:hypothetical protein